MGRPGRGTYPKREKAKQFRRDPLTVEERAAHNLILKDPKYAASAKILEKGIIHLHKVYVAMTKKVGDAVQLAWDADR